MSHLKVNESGIETFPLCPQHTPSWVGVDLSRKILLEVDEFGF
jgi:hypothetical protein